MLYPSFFILLIPCFFLSLLYTVIFLHSIFFLLLLLFLIPFFLSFLLLCFFSLLLYDSLCFPFYILSFFFLKLGIWVLAFLLLCAIAFKYKKTEKECVKCVWAVFLCHSVQAWSKFSLLLCIVPLLEPCILMDCIFFSTSLLPHLFFHPIIP